jgi:hypothetical protein
MKGTATMDHPGAFYAITLHTPHLRDTLTSDSARPRSPHPASRLALIVLIVRRSLAHTFRALAAHLDTPPVTGDARLAPTR